MPVTAGAAPAIAETTRLAAGMTRLNTALPHVATRTLTPMW